MTDEQIALARRAVACKGWRWMPGMLAVEWSAPGMSLTGGRPVRVDDGWHEVGVWLPDLSDPATLGCLLALVREAWGDPTICVVLDLSDGYWHVGRWEDEGIALRGRWGTTEAHALTLALEGAP
jgi:hypothetical protein